MSDLTISEKIRKARRESDLTQTELAIKIDVSLSSIQRIEKGEVDVGINLLKKISAATKMPISFFIDEIQIAKNISKEVLDALDDPIAVRTLLMTYKNSQEIKLAIRQILECLTNMPIEKRKALLTLCQ